MKSAIRMVTTGAAVLALAACGMRSDGGASGDEPGSQVTTVAAPAEWAAEVDSARVLMREAIRAGTAGLAVAVFRSGEPLWVEGLGFADLAEQDRVDPDRARFRIYSVTKPMTATAAARLMERGRLDPEAPVQDYVGSWSSGPDPITAMHLANHTAGIRHYADEDEAAGTRHCETVTDALPIFAGDPLLHAPGTRESYSSWGYVLLSAVIESAAGTSFMPAMERLVFEPAGIASAAMDDPRTDLDGRAGTYEEVDGSPRPAPAVDITCKWGAGALLATAPDVARFGSAMLDGTLLSPPTLQLFFRGSDVYRAQGVGAGGTAFMIIDAANDLSIALLTNTSGERAGPAAQAAAQGIHDLLGR